MCSVCARFFCRFFWCIYWARTFQSDKRKTIFFSSAVKIRRRWEIHLFLSIHFCCCCFALRYIIFLLCDLLLLFVVLVRQLYWFILRSFAADRFALQSKWARFNNLDFSGLFSFLSSRISLVSVHNTQCNKKLNQCNKWKKRSFNNRTRNKNIKKKKYKAIQKQTYSSLFSNVENTI